MDGIVARHHYDVLVVDDESNSPETDALFKINNIIIF